MIRRYALLADIHSNVMALDAVLNDLSVRGVDIIINLGDILYGPLAPLATFQLLQTHEIVTIRGNQDRQIYEATDAEIADNPTMVFILDDLGTEPVDWLRSLPPTATINREIFACHGTPTDDLEYLIEDISSGLPVVRDNDAIVDRLGDITEPLVACAHSHRSRVVQLGSDRLVVNPGSVGLPAYRDEEPIAHHMENYSPHASYAIVERGDYVPASVEVHRVAYDFVSAAAQAMARGRGDWSHALATGRAGLD